MLFHRFVEWLGLEGTLGSSSSTLPAMARDFLLDQVVESPILALNISRDYTHTQQHFAAFFWCITTLTAKNFFLKSTLNLPCLSLKPLPLVLSLHSLALSSTPSSLLVCFRYWKATIRIYCLLEFPSFRTTKTYFLTHLVNQFYPEVDKHNNIIGNYIYDLSWFRSS